jgi:hypothetical protein
MYDIFQLEYIERETIIHMLNLSILGITAFLVGFRSPLYKVFGSFCKPLRLTWIPERAYKLAIHTGIFGLIVLYLSIAKKFIFLSQGTTVFLGELSRFSIAILYLMILQKKMKFSGKIFFLIIFVIRMLIDLSTGCTSLIVGEISIILFLFIYHYKKIPWLQMGIGLLFFILVFAVRDEYRKYTWFEGEYATADPFKKAGVYLKLISERILNSGGEKITPEDYRKIMSRASALVTFAKVVYLTPEYVPYWGGYTYRYLYTSIIPRFLYPQKPVKILGQEFGHRYELLDPFDQTTSYNLPVLVEFYINFGVWGIIIGMLMIGIFFRNLYIFFNHPDAGEAGIVIGTIIFIGLYNLESDLSLILGNTLHYIILLYFLLKFNLATAKNI